MLKPRLGLILIHWVITLPASSFLLLTFYSQIFLKRDELFHFYTNEFNLE